MNRGPGRAQSRQKWQEGIRGMAASEETRQGSLERERDQQTHKDIVRLPARKREVRQESEMTNSHVKQKDISRR